MVDEALPKDGLRWSKDSSLYGIDRLEATAKQDFSEREVHADTSQCPRITRSRNRCTWRLS